MCRAVQHAVYGPCLVETSRQRAERSPVAARRPRLASVPLHGGRLISSVNPAACSAPLISIAATISSKLARTWSDL